MWRADPVRPYACGGSGHLDPRTGRRVPLSSPWHSGRFARANGVPDPGHRGKSERVADPKPGVKTPRPRTVPTRGGTVSRLVSDGSRTEMPAPTARSHVTGWQARARDNARPAVTERGNWGPRVVAAWGSGRSPVYGRQRSAGKAQGGSMRTACDRRSNVARRTPRQEKLAESDV